MLNRSHLSGSAATSSLRVSCLTPSSSKMRDVHKLCTLPKQDGITVLEVVNMVNFQSIGIFVGVLAMLSAVADMMPNSPFKLKDLNEPQENLASHSDVWKLILSSELDNQKVS